MTTYYYPSDTFFGGAITVGPADEIVDFHGSGVSVDLFGTAISSTLLDGFETVERLLGQRLDDRRRTERHFRRHGHWRDDRHLRVPARRRGDRRHARERHRRNDFV